MRFHFCSRRLSPINLTLYIHLSRQIALSVLVIEIDPHAWTLSYAVNNHQRSYSFDLQCATLHMDMTEIRVLFNSENIQCPANIPLDVTVTLDIRPNGRVRIYTNRRSRHAHNVRKFSNSTHGQMVMQFRYCISTNVEPAGYESQTHASCCEWSRHATHTCCSFFFPFLSPWIFIWLFLCL